MSDCCNICSLSFTSHTRSKITCPQCSESACLVCFSKYILETVADNPICMFNKCTLSDTFIKNNINSNFLNKLIKKQREIEFERLKLQIPQAMHYIDLYQQSKQIQNQYQIL